MYYYGSSNNREENNKKKTKDYKDYSNIYKLIYQSDCSSGLNLLKFNPKKFILIINHGT
jgi:hypothetical protein